jgi:hypothetical protein
MEHAYLVPLQIFGMSMQNLVFVAPQALSLASLGNVFAILVSLILMQIIIA